MVQPVIKSVIFDLDGVLVRHDLESPLRLFARLAGVSVDDLRAEYDRLGLVLAGASNESISECARMELALKGLGVERFGASGYPCDHDFYSPNSYPIEEVREIVYYLDSRGYSIGMFTDTAPEITQAEYSAFSVFDSYFPIVISSSVDEPVAEGDFIDGLNNYKFQPAGTLFVGDNPQDIQTAAKAGMPALLFENPSQLKKDLSKMLGIEVEQKMVCLKKRTIDITLNEPGKIWRFRHPCADADVVVNFHWKSGAGYRGYLRSEGPFYINDHYAIRGKDLALGDVYIAYMDFDPILRSDKSDFSVVLRATKEEQSFYISTLRTANHQSRSNYQGGGSSIDFSLFQKSI